MISRKLQQVQKNRVTTNCTIAICAIDIYQFGAIALFYIAQISIAQIYIAQISIAWMSIAQISIA